MAWPCVLQAAAYACTSGAPGDRPTFALQRGGMRPLGPGPVRVCYNIFVYPIFPELENHGVYFPGSREISEILS